MPYVCYSSGFAIFQNFSGYAIQIQIVQFHGSQPAHTVIRTDEIHAKSGVPVVFFSIFRM